MWLQQSDAAVPRGHVATVPPSVATARTRRYRCTSSRRMRDCTHKRESCSICCALCWELQRVRFGEDAHQNCVDPTYPILQLKHIAEPSPNSNLSSSSKALAVLLNTFSSHSRARASPHPINGASYSHSGDESGDGTLSCGIGSSSGLRPSSPPIFLRQQQRQQKACFRGRSSHPLRHERHHLQVSDDPSRAVDGCLLVMSGQSFRCSCSRVLPLLLHPLHVLRTTVSKWECLARADFSPPFRAMPMRLYVCRELMKLANDVLSSLVRSFSIHRVL